MFEAVPLQDAKVFVLYMAADSIMSMNRCITVAPSKMNDILRRLFDDIRFTDFSMKLLIMDSPWFPSLYKA